MFSIAAITDDDSLRVALKAAAAATLSPAALAKLRWASEDAAAVDLLLLDPAAARDEAPRPQATLTVAVVRDLSADAADADFHLPWPCSPSLATRQWQQWVEALRARVRQRQLDTQIDKLARANNSLRRQSARCAHQLELRDRHDGNLRDILSRMEGITRLSQQINSLQLDEIVDLCIERAPQLVGARLASLYLHDAERNRLRLQKHNHPYPITASIDLGERPNSPMAVAVARKQLLMLNDKDWAELAAYSVTRRYAHRYATGSCVIAPLFSAGRVVGVLNLADRRDGLPFDELVDLLPIRQLSELLGASIRNIELYQAVQQQANSDGMTGLANHGAFVHELGREIHRARRYGGPLSLILADVDSLKHLNDHMGHLAGDRALQLVARQIVRSIRESDLAARYGGDEFAILLPQTDVAAARAVAERIIETLSQVPVVLDRRSSYITVSVGIGQYDGAGTAAHFIDQVDQAMYRAKQQGKNRIAAA